MSKSASGNKRSPFSGISLHEMARIDGNFRHTRQATIIEEDDMDAFSPKMILDFHCNDSSDDENKMQEDIVVLKPRPLQRESPLAASSNKPSNLSAFPVGRHNLTAFGAKKPLTIGGSRSKRDFNGKCVSEAVLKLSLKDESPCEDDSPVQRKRPALEKKEPALLVSRPIPAITLPFPLKSMNGTRKTGDHSQIDFQDPLLPMIKSQKHPDLKCISAGTLGGILRKQICKDLIENLWIVDCRYPFEFNAGHIKDAINCYHRGDLTEKFLNTPYCRKDPAKRHIVIFHCEFSSKRGPDMLRFLRAQDREMNQHCYPRLAYPELYLLEGGYKAFFEACQDLCEPRFYTPMDAEAHKGDVSHYKAKAKSFHDFSLLGTKSKNKHPKTF